MKPVKPDQPKKILYPEDEMPDAQDGQDEVIPTLISLDDFYDLLMEQQEQS